MCAASCDWTRLERILGPDAVAATTAAAVSSQLVSMPRTIMFPCRRPRGGVLASRPVRWSAGWRYLVGLEGLVGGGVDFEQLDRIAPQRRRMADYSTAALFFEQHPIMHIMRKYEAAIASEIDIDHLNVGLAPGQIILPRQCAANFAIADV